MQIIPPPSDGSVLFANLVAQYASRPERRSRIIDAVDRKFRRAASIMVVDTCGFTRSLRDQGVVPFLALLLGLEESVAVRVGEAGGRHYFREADNFFSLFSTVDAAVACGEAILEDVAIANRGARKPDQLAVSIGVGYGTVLLIGHGQIYGEEFNITSKVGEDLAGPDELMLTAGALLALSPSDRVFEERRLTVSGLEIVAHLLQRGSDPPS